MPDKVFDKLQDLNDENPADNNLLGLIAELQQDNVSLQKQRDNHNFSIEKKIKWALFVFFCAGLVLIFAIFVIYIYNIIREVENHALNNVAITLIGIMVGNVMGILISKFIK